MNVRKIPVGDIVWIFESELAKHLPGQDGADEDEQALVPPFQDLQQTFMFQVLSFLHWFNLVALEPFSTPSPSSFDHCEGPKKGNRGDRGTCQSQASSSSSLSTWPPPARKATYWWKQPCCPKSPLAPILRELLLESSLRRRKKAYKPHFLGLRVLEPLGFQGPLFRLVDTLSDDESVLTET